MIVGIHSISAFEALRTLREPARSQPVARRVIKRKRKVTCDSKSKPRRKVACKKKSQVELQDRGPRITPEIVIDGLPQLGHWFADLTGEYVGRPTKLTRAVHEQIVRLVLEGNYPSVAARACGISRQLWQSYKRDWKAKGEHSKYAQLFEDVEQAEAMAQTDLVAQLRSQTRLPGKETNSTATLSMLERRFNERDERWIPRTATELSGPDGGPIENTSEVSDKFKSKLEAVEASLAALNQKEEG